MIVAGRELIFQQGFLDALLRLEQWAGQQDPRKGRVLVKRIVDFASDVIAPFPLAFPRYQSLTGSTRPLHRAVLDRRYLIIYEVQETQLLLVYVYSTSQSPNLPELLAGE